MKLSRTFAERAAAHDAWVEENMRGRTAFAWWPVFLDDVEQWVWLERYKLKLFNSYDKGWIFKNVSMDNQ